MSKSKTIIGWKEYIDLPDWGVKGLKAKVDTGARSAALHVENLKEIDAHHISFQIVLADGVHKKKVSVTAKKLKKASVKSSIGVKTSRWYVETRLKLGSITKKIRVNLVGREGMNFRMLLGRLALEGDFAVDVSKEFVVSRSKKKKGKK